MIKNTEKNKIHFHSNSPFDEHIKNNQTLENLVVFEIDLFAFETELLKRDIRNCYFVGCNINSALLNKILNERNYVLPLIKLPYSMFQDKLYSRNSLFNNYDAANNDSYKSTKDYLIYKHFLSSGGLSPTSMHESFARNMHDRAVEESMNIFLRERMSSRKFIGIMGGHAISRKDSNYKKTALIAKSLTENQCLIFSGGGPGMMEAAHLGAHFAGRSNLELNAGLELMQSAQYYQDPLWLSKSYEVMEKYPQNYGFESLGIPTWVYGHEPPNPFPTHIAKFFSVTVRQEGLLSIAKDAVVYSPGSVGTMSEAFQDVQRNHYNNESKSAMIFLDKEFWTEKTPLFPLLKKMSKDGIYNNLILSIFDSPEEIVGFIYNKK
jgi:predicted Rossmann-fold nucleotide-binding protein